MQAPGQIQRSSGKGSEGSGEGLGGFGAEPGQVQQGSGEGSGEGLKEAFVQSQVRFNSVPEKVLAEALVQPGQVQQGSGEGSSAWLRSTLQKDL